MECSSTNNDTCLNSCDNKYLINSPCSPCIPPALVISDVQNITPILTNTIINCTSVNNAQYMRSSPVQFMLDGPCSSYLTNAQICINSVSYSYDCLGKSLPVSFYICDRQQTFDVDGGGCSCFFNTIPDSLENLINTALNSSNATLGLAESTLSISSPVSSKTTATIAAAVSLGTTLVDTADALTAIIDAAYPGAASGTLEGAIIDLTSANVYISDAANLIPGLLTSAFPYPAATVEDIAQYIYNSDPGANSATEYLTQAAQYIIASPASSSYAISEAQAALSTIQLVNQLAENAFNNTSTQTFTNITNLVSLAAEAEINVYNALNDTASSDGTMQSYLSSLFDAFYAVTLSAFASQAIYSSTVTTSQTTQVNNLNSAARAIIDSVAYIQDALSFTNTVTQASLYNNFDTLICSSGCDNRCCNLNCDNNVSLLFFQEIPSYEICNLTIKISGTIGEKCFTASSKFSGINDLSSFGFNTITINSNICVPKGCYSLKERLDPCFSILRVIPEENYNSNNKPNSSYIQTSLYSYFLLKTDLIVTRKNTSALFTRTVSCTQ